MNVKEAAKDYIVDVFADEQITHVGLEEVEFDDVSKAWKITVGFFRPWEKPAENVLEATISVLPAHGNRRSFKVVRIKDQDGQVASITDRFLAIPS